MDLLYRAFGAEHVWLQLTVAALAIFALALLLTPLLGAVSHRFGILSPGDRERDTRPDRVPLLGGVAFFLAFMIGMALFEPLTGNRRDSLSGVSINTGNLMLQLHGLLLGATVAVAIGVLDDLLNLRPAVHFLGQIAAAAVALIGGFATVRGISNPLANHFFYAQPEKHLQILLPLPMAGAFTLFWIVAMMNTVNFLDGLDGLAGGVVTIAAILLAIWSGRVHGQGATTLTGSEVLVLPPLILAAALIGFLVFNWAPARIFMGDCGAQFAGFTLGALAILGPAKIGTALLILAVPILDIAWVFVRRPTKGGGFASADRGHLHHRLLDRGMSTRRIVLSFYAICAALGAIDLVLTHTSKLIAFLVVTVATVVLLIRVTERTPGKPFLGRPVPPARR
ncbi:MAG TPA: MraY family glycosyltransferase [Chloroflexota bacterium]|nr:MraY family glycosyltransferase [Chloroflexota bacterium]